MKWKTKYSTYKKIQRLAESIQKNSTYKINHKDEQIVNKVKKAHKSMQKSIKEHITGTQGKQCTTIQCKLPT